MLNNFQMNGDLSPVRRISNIRNKKDYLTNDDNDDLDDDQDVNTKYSNLQDSYSIDLTQYREYHCLSLSSPAVASSEKTNDLSIKCIQEPVHHTLSLKVQDFISHALSSDDLDDQVDSNEIKHVINDNSNLNRTSSESITSFDYITQSLPSERFIVNHGNHDLSSYKSPDQISSLETRTEEYLSAICRSHDDIMAHKTNLKNMLQEFEIRKISILDDIKELHEKKSSEDRSVADFRQSNQSTLNRLEKQKKHYNRKMKTIDKKVYTISHDSNSNSSINELTLERQDTFKRVEKIDCDMNDLMMKISENEKLYQDNIRTIDSDIDGRVKEIRELTEKLPIDEAIFALKKAEETYQTNVNNLIEQKKEIDRQYGISLKNPQYSSTKALQRLRQLIDDQLNQDPRENWKSELQLEVMNLKSVILNSSDGNRIDDSLLQHKNCDKVQTLTSSVESVREETVINTDESHRSTNKLAFTESASVHDMMMIPGPHSAALSGDLTTIRTLKKLEPSLLTSVDKHHRCPVYYSVVNRMIDMTRYLLDHYPETSHLVDVNGESLVHVATAVDDPISLELIITKLRQSVVVDVKSFINRKNNSGMTAAHIAKNVKCLEILFSHDADMSVVDNDGRNPLFIACALNNVHTAEFIINHLDLVENGIMIRDSRGDTPLHAASCNGAIDCMLLLLQYAIDPNILNEKGYTALELAIKNNHDHCKKLLLEYTLHYYSHADFDSVLFLSVLEGLREVKKESNMKRLESYNIVNDSPRNQSLASKAGSKINSQIHKLSLFSLKDENSMSMQRWGQWIEYRDIRFNQSYWYNHENNVGQWSVPDEVVRLRNMIFEGSALSADKDTVKVLNMKLKKNGEWMQYSIDNGKTFYYNEKNGNFQWTKPCEISISNVINKYSQDADDIAVNCLMETETLTTQNKDSRSFGDWQPYMDPASGYVFWYNKITQVSQWDYPIDLLHRETCVDNRNDIIGEELGNAFIGDDVHDSRFGSCNDGYVHTVKNTDDLEL